jgi:hypothetical protein
MRTCFAAIALAALATGCAVFQPSLRRADGGLPRASAALWLPTGYEASFVLDPQACPPGSLAEAMAQAAPARLGVRDFAARFPGSEEDVLAYHREWEQYVAQTILPLLRGQSLPSDWPVGLARQLDPVEAEDIYLASAVHLHHALEQSPPAPTRRRLEALLAVHEVQRLRALAILSLANAASASDARNAVEAARQLVRFRELAPLSLQAWSRAQLEAERGLGDLAGNDWCGLFAEAKPIQSLADQQAAVLPDSANRGLSESWQKSWPKDSPAQTSLTWEEPVTGTAGVTVLWVRTKLVLPPDRDATFFLNLRGVSGKVDAFVDGVLLGSHTDRDDGRVSCRFSLDSLRRGSSPRSLVFRFERSAEAAANPARWHVPWLSARFAD